MDQFTNITWQTVGVDMPDIDRPMLERWIEAVASSYDKVAGALSYIFVNDAEILRVNLEFLQHDYYTDIITFDYSKRRVINGDMFISLDTVRTNAEKFGYEYANELHRVIIHGVLHLCGINDKGPGEREIMEAAECKALALLDEISR